jgi:hypothetical protein
MAGLHLQERKLFAAAACLAILLAVPDMSSAQGRRKKSTKAPPRAKAADRNASAADRIALRDGKELLGQVAEPASKGALVVIARREWLRNRFPARMEEWAVAERKAAATALAQRRQRLEAWRRARPSVAAPGDRITPWIDRELAKQPGADRPATLMAVQIPRAEVATVQKRGDQATRALRAAWLLGLPEPETTPLATLVDSIAGRGMSMEGDDPFSVDRLLPLSIEPEDRWVLRRAATEVLNDDGLRFIRIGASVLPEPVPGQPPDPKLGATLVDGTIRDVLAGGRADPLPGRLGGIGQRGRVGAMVTRIELAADLSSASAEAALYANGTGGWERGAWRSGSLRVGEMPPFVVTAVASDPQVKSLLDLVDSLGAGLVSPEMKQRGLAIGTTAGGAAIMARAALIKALTVLAFDLEDNDAKRKR